MICWKSGDVRLRCRSAIWLTKAIIVLLPLIACDKAERVPLIGKYQFVNSADTATLKIINENRYEFCNSDGQCETASYTLEKTYEQIGFDRLDLGGRLAAKFDGAVKSVLYDGRNCPCLFSGAKSFGPRFEKVAGN